LLWIVVRVVKAELVRSFASLKGVSKMQPYAEVEWCAADGTTKEVARTQTDSSSGLSFQWHHTCRELPYMGKGAGDKVVFTVYNTRIGGLTSPTLCGSVSVLVDDLLSGCQVPSSGYRFSCAPTVELTLRKRDEDTGVLTIQALLVRSSSKQSSGRPDEQMTHVEAARFETSVKRLGVSGGTAPFFRLQLRPEVTPHLGARWSKEYYIGKDLSHARDEVNFYEDALQDSKQPDGGALQGLHRFMFEYAGILSCTVEGAASDDEPTELLVMRNLHDGCQSLRLLDIKIGQRTADAGWQGKSRAAAMRQGIIDGVTNSCEEGFRLEGFDGVPPALRSMDPLMDLQGLAEESRFQPKVRKKALRIMFQRMSAVAMLMHFLDVHQVPESPKASELAGTLAPVELAELVLHEIVRRLAELALACRLVPVPQKWIGSSVALGFDCGGLPSRQQPEQAVREAVKVHIFDWGRSELNTLEKHMAMSESEKKDRAQFWGYYKGGIDRLLWESMRAYWHRFGNAAAWDKACITVYDFDSMSDNDFIGQVHIPLERTPLTTVALTDTRGARCFGAGSVTTVTYSVEYQAMAASSRLKGTWRVQIAKAANLKACDTMQRRPASDPFAVLTVSTQDMRHCFRQQTSVVINNLNPEWNETLEVPVAARQGLLENALSWAAASHGGTAATQLRADPVGPLLPPEQATREAVEQAIAGWQARLDRAAAATSGPALCSDVI